LSTAYPVELALADPQVGERYKLLDDGRSVNEIWVGSVYPQLCFLSQIDTFSQTGHAFDDLEISRLDVLADYTQSLFCQHFLPSLQNGWLMFLDGTMALPPNHGMTALLMKMCSSMLPRSPGGQKS
jgi:hypothetical protein